MNNFYKKRSDFLAFVFDENILLEQIDTFIVENSKNIINDIKTLVDIPSVNGEATDAAPFGKEIKTALDTALKMADDIGLTTTNVDGYFGFADLIGESETQIAAITHLDVVPAGNGWQQDAFNMVEKDGYLIGRGVVDNKGPGILTLYIAKFFAQYYKKLPYTFRVMFGTNEETGMKGLTYYLNKYNNPAFCFTPDGNFPLGYAEKGLYGGEFFTNEIKGNIKSFKGGVATNVVPDSAVAIVNTQFNNLPKQNNITLEDKGNGTVQITAKGKGGHASLPQGTVNAIGILAKYLLKTNICTKQENEFLTLLTVIHADTDGTSCNINAVDDIFTPLTCVGGTIDYVNFKYKQTVDIRYPTSITHDKIENELNKISNKYCCVHTCVKYKEPFVTGADTPMVKALMNSYNKITGKNEKPFSMGGGTYARCFNSAVSFGIEESDNTNPDWVGEIHGANEGVSVSLLEKSLKIFILGVANLMNLQF